MKHCCSHMAMWTHMVQLVLHFTLRKRNMRQKINCNGRDLAILCQNLDHPWRGHQKVFPLVLWTCKLFFSFCFSLLPFLFQEDFLAGIQKVPVFGWHLRHTVVSEPFTEPSWESDVVQAATGLVHCQMWSCITRVLAHNLLVARESLKEI